MLATRIRKAIKWKEKKQKRRFWLKALIQYPKFVYQRYAYPQGLQRGRFYFCSHVFLSKKGIERDIMILRINEFRTLLFVRKGWDVVITTFQRLA